MAAAKLNRVESVGSERTRLVVLRGNSGSGKSSCAVELRTRLGRGVALVQQDFLRRVVLREHDVPGGINIGLISQTVRYALNHDYHVILEGILDSGRYSEMLQGLERDHLGVTSFYYFDISFAETMRRHATRPQAAEFGLEIMLDLYRERDFLDFVTEEVIGEESTLEHSVARIFFEAF